MQPSLLRLDAIYFHKVHVDTNPNPKLNAEYDIDSSVKVLRNQEDSAKWKVELSVAFNGENVPYWGNFLATGAYSTRGDQSDEATLNLVNVNGPSILYSAIREMVINITSRGPHSPLLLPSITFSDRKQKRKLDSTKSEESPKSNPETVNGTE